MDFTCESIGMKQEELQERVVDGLVERILGGRIEDGVAMTVMEEANTLIEAAIKTAVVKIGEEHIYPMAEKLITDHVFQETTKWGEKRGEPMSFTECLVERANAFFLDEVNHDGKSKDQLDQYHRNNFHSAGTRVTVLIEKHLKYHIETAMKTAVSAANETLVEGLAQTARVKLHEISEQLKVEVKTK